METTTTTANKNVKNNTNINQGSNSMNSINIIKLKENEVNSFPKTIPLLTSQLNNNNQTQNNLKLKNPFETKENKKEPNKINTIKEENVNNDPINLIYLIDTTYSMKQFENEVYSIREINKKLKQKYAKIQFGYVFYKDFLGEGNDCLQLGLDHIKVQKLSPSTEVIFGEFKEGYDYAEDWANAYYEASEMELNNCNLNILVHICDSFPHGNRFSDYDNKNEQEELLMDALKCCERNYRIIALLLSEFSRKAFLECKDAFFGFYQIYDLTQIKIKKLSFEDITRKIIENEIDDFKGRKTEEEQKKEKEELNYIEFDDYTESDFEQDFEFQKSKVRMASLKFNEKYGNMTFLPNIDSEQRYSVIDYLNEQKELKKNIGIKQGNLGDCYLITSILSILFNQPNSLKHIFSCLSYDIFSDNITMNLYKNGIKRKITFRNTYAFEYDNDYSEEKDLIFAKPLDNTFLGLCLEKGYAVLNSDKKSIKTGYQNIIGGFQYKVYNTFFGNPSETFNFFGIKNKDNILTCEEMFNKIKKYIDNGGFVNFGVFFNIRKDGKIDGHAYSVIGYKEFPYDEALIEILNPWRAGYYCENNIKKYDEYRYLSSINKKQFDSQEISENITEDEFNKKVEGYDLKKIFDNYGKTGYLLMPLKTFYKWISFICMYDPMLESYEQIIEIPKQVNDKEVEFSFSIKDNIKILAFLLSNESIELDKKKQTEYLLGEAKINDEGKYRICIDGKYNNSSYIYENLEKGYNHTLKILTKDNSNISDFLYLKILSTKEINFVSKNDLSNGILIKAGIPGNIPPKDLIGILLYKLLHLIENLNKLPPSIPESLLRFKEFFSLSSSKMKNDFPPIPGFREEFNMIFKYYYIDFINYKEGFVGNIIKKSDFNWDCKALIFFDESSKEYSAFFEFGSFKFKKDLILYDFDSKFKNLIEYLKIDSSSLDLMDTTNIISDLNKKFEIQKEKKENIESSINVGCGCWRDELNSLSKIKNNLLKIDGPKTIYFNCNEDEKYTTKIEIDSEICEKEKILEKYANKIGLKKSELYDLDFNDKRYSDFIKDKYLDFNIFDSIYITVNIERKLSLENCIKILKKWKEKNKK